MEQLLLVQFLMIGIALTFAVFFIARSDESLSRKWARVRVRVDDSMRRQVPDPPDEEKFEQPRFLEWTIFVGIILLILTFLANL